MIDPINQGHGRGIGKKIVQEVTKPREKNDVHDAEEDE
jgi:hypothetical protein